MNLLWKIIPKKKKTPEQSEVEVEEKVFESKVESTLSDSMTATLKSRFRS